MQSNLLQQLLGVEKIANLSKWGRFLYHPYKYIFAYLFRKIIYPVQHAEKIVEVELFFGQKMKIALPASTDIYLTKGKSHDSEIRLARFMIQHLKEGNHFLDIGAHYGYFTRLAQLIIGEKGKIIACEPAVKTYRLLTQNCLGYSTITLLPKAVSNTLADIVFYEFPNLQSEYNSTDIIQFEKEQWYDGAKPTITKVAATTIDIITKTYEIYPNIIKIDVEGGEYEVIEGGLNYLQTSMPIIVMEYLAASRHNKPHLKATQKLLELGYVAHIIVHDGSLQVISNIDDYLLTHKLDSDNIVFKKNT